MARGKTPLSETVDESEIIDLGEELNQPNIMITDGYGVRGVYMDYALVELKTAHRTGKSEDGEYEGKVIRYKRWDDINYSATIFGCLKNYCEYVNLTKIKTLKKCKDFSEIEAIFKETNNTINKFLSHYDLTKEQTQSAKLIDTINMLEDKIKNANKIFKAVDDLHELVKEKRKIVIGDTEPKKHRMLKEEE